ncbi:MAG: hypothetical protein NT140_06255, partial [Deltaproteobacteria bacterium]|nr:hypothetical protein [Deltaproteobacteria bacterium]
KSGSCPRFSRKEFMQNHQDIINLIKSAPAIDPPEDFTPRVMASVMQERAGAYTRAWHFLAAPREFTLDPIKALRTGISRDEMSLYFLLVAFAHLALAVVLYIGFKNSGFKTSDAGALFPPLLLLQPGLSLFLAGWLGFWGFLLRKNPQSGIKGARFASLLYLEVVVIGGALLLMELCLVLIPFVAAMVGISVAAGIFLALSCGIEKVRSNNGSYCVGIKP